MASLLFATSARAQEKLDPEHPVTVFRLTDDGSLTIKFSVQTAGGATYLSAEGETLTLDGQSASKFSFLVADYSEPLLVTEKDGDVLFSAADGKLDEASTGTDLALDSALFTGNGVALGPPKDGKMPIRFRIPKWFPVVGGCYFGAAYDPGSRCTFMVVVCYDANGKITRCRMGHFCEGMKPTINNCFFHGFPNGIPDWLPGPGNVPAGQGGAAQ
jgi:hypothetical protein